MMKKLIVQFYATPNEIGEFLTEKLREGLPIVLVEQPGLVISIVSSESDLCASRFSKVVQAAIFREPIRPNFESWSRFLDANPNGLILTVGHLDERVLGESWLSAQSSSEEVMKEWRKVANKVKRETTAGGWVTDSKNNISVFYKDIRYTGGALKLFDEGFQIAALGGKYLVLLRDPAKEPGV